MGNLHQMVINDIGQMVRRQLVGTFEEHLVVKNIGLHTHLTTNQVVDQHLLPSLNLETYHILLAVGNQLFHLCLGKGQ